MELFHRLYPNARIFGRAAADLAALDYRVALLQGKGVPVKGLVEGIKAFAICDEALSTTEYAVMLAFIALFAIAALTQFGTHVSGLYSAIDETMPGT